MPQVYAVLAALAVRLGGLRLDPMGGGILNDVFRGVALVGDAAVPLLLIILGLQLAETGRITEGPQSRAGDDTAPGALRPPGAGPELPVEPRRALDEACRDALEHANGCQRDHTRDRVQRPSPLREQRRRCLNGGERVHPHADPCPPRRRLSGGSRSTVSAKSVRCHGRLTCLSAVAVSPATNAETGGVAFDG